MNIQKTDLMLLNRVRFGAEQPTNTETAPVPQDGTQNAQAGMNALMFRGMQNLMSNPSLAQRVNLNDDGTEETKDQNGVAFKGGKVKTFVKALPLVAALTLGGAALQSCDKFDEPDQITQTVTVNVEQHSEMEAIMSALLAEIQGLRNDMANRDAQWQKKFDALYDIVNKLLARVNSIDANVYTLTNTLKDIKNSQNEFIPLIKDHFASEKEAIAWFQDKIASLEDKAAKGLLKADDINAFLAEILGYVKNIDANVAQLVKFAAQQAKNDFLALMYAQQIAMNTGATAYNTAMTNASLQKLLAATDSIMAREEDIKAAIQEADKNNQAGQKAELELQKQILNEIKALRKDYNAGRLDAQAFAKAVLASLSKIDYKLSAAVGGIAELIRVEKQNTYFNAATAANTAAMRTILGKMLPMILQMEGNIYNKLLEQGVTKDDLEELFKWLNDNQNDRSNNEINAANANKDEIIDAIDNLSLKLDVLQPMYELMLEMNDKIGQGGSGATDLSKLYKQLEQITNLLKNLKPCDCKDYTALLNEIKDKIQPCNCDHDKIEILITQILNQLKHEGIIDDGFIS